MTDFTIVEYDEIRAGIDAVKNTANFIPDVSTDDGYNKSKQVSLDIGKLLTSLEKKRKDKKAYFLEGGREVDAQAKSIKAELEEIQEPHKEAYKRLDSEKKEREAQRKAALEARVTSMRELPDRLADSSSGEVMAALVEIKAEECLDFYEFTEQALKARNASRDTLQSLFVKKQKEESEAAELAKLRAEAEARAKQEREDQIRKEASEKAEREKAEAVAREEAAKEAEKRAIEEKEAQRLRAIEAERAAEEARKNAELNAEIAAKKAAEEAKQAEVKRQEDLAIAEQKAEEARLANKRHIGQIRKEAKEDLMSLGFSEADAKKVVLAISNGAVRNATINY